jgi:hypothetical protein
MGNRTKKELATTKAPAASRVEVPDPDPGWHPIARMYWDAFAESGQTRFWEPSDWVALHDVMEDLSRYKESGRRSSQMRSAIDSTLARLAVTDGDRRRLRIELTRGLEEAEAGPAEVAVMDDYRDLYG